jgi:hypothetical protein
MRHYICILLLFISEYGHEIAIVNVASSLMTVLNEYYCVNLAVIWLYVILDEFL